MIATFLQFTLLLLCFAKSHPSSVRKSTRVPIVILPGFGNDIVDYQNPLGKGFDISIQAALEKRGYSVSIVPIKRFGWLNIARGLFQKSFYDYSRYNK